MSNPDHLAKLLQGQDAWNAWREADPDIVPDLSGAALTERAGISRAILSGGLDLRGAMLQDADLSGASLREADLTYACLEGADLRQADLSRSALIFADLSDTNLTGARLDNADLAGASLSRARLGGADLTLAVGLTNAQIRSAYCDLETQLPTYLDAADIYKDPELEAAAEIEDDPVAEEMLAAEGETPEAGTAPPKRKRPINPYRVLEVTPQATALELRNAYLRLAKKYHPDVNPGDAEAEQRFKDVNEAYRRAAARSRSKLDAKRGGRAKFWAAATAFFLVSAIAASVAVYLISSPKPVDLHARTAPDEPNVTTSGIKQEADDPETAAEIA
ncbi:MAG TPA: pentapeptide repeat-containing protein, partial [Hyphomicrobiales bacterium]